MKRDVPPLIRSRRFKRGTEYARGSWRGRLRTEKRFQNSQRMRCSNHCYKFNPRECTEGDMVALFEAAFLTSNNRYNPPLRQGRFISIIAQIIRCLPQDRDAYHLASRQQRSTSLMCARLGTSCRSQGHKSRPSSGHLRSPHVPDMRAVYLSVTTRATYVSESRSASMSFTVF